MISLMKANLGLISAVQSWSLSEIVLIIPFV
jgi:hypothetical protein